MIPLFVSIIIFLVPRLYVGQGFEIYGRLDNGKRIEWDLIKYIPAIFKENLFMKIGQLWFLPVLFIVFIVNYPLLAWSRRRFM